MNLTDKIALVTGGARGIGRGIALALARAGADVAVSDVDRVAPGAQQYGTAAVGGFTAARATAEEIRALGRRSTAIEADVTSDADVKRMIAETTKALGGLDLLVCNAGVVSVSPVEEMTEEAFDLTLAVNVKGVFLCCRAAIPALKARGGGAILNVAYCASKFAVVGFTSSLAKELAPHGIRANAICPGILRTQMWEYLAEKLAMPGEGKEQAWERYVKGLIPLGRPQTPDDIGELAVYLAGAENVTGQAINVDGGIELH
jgi:meso-butanediol dehydrogenase / (S,S)-butanediol dehydrogenase / diacetyl reductase